MATSIAIVALLLPLSSSSRAAVATTAPRPFYGRTTMTAGFLPPCAPMRITSTSSIRPALTSRCYAVPPTQQQKAEEASTREEVRAFPH